MRSRRGSRPRRGRRPRTWGLARRAGQRGGQRGNGERLFPPETLDEKRRELLPEIRIQAFELERLLHPLGVAEPVEGGVAGVGLAGGVLGEREAGEDFEVTGRVLERGETRDSEVIGRFPEASGPIGRLALSERRRPGVLLSPRGGHQDE